MLHYSVTLHYMSSLCSVCVCVKNVHFVTDSSQRRVILSVSCIRYILLYYIFGVLTSSHLRYIQIFFYFI